jgi:hypothetical protein
VVVMVVAVVVVVAEGGSGCDGGEHALVHGAAQRVAPVKPRLAPRSGQFVEHEIDGAHGSVLWWLGTKLFHCLAHFLRGCTRQVGVNHSRSARVDGDVGVFPRHVHCVRVDKRLGEPVGNHVPQAHGFKRCHGTGAFRAVLSRDEYYLSDQRVQLIQPDRGVREELHLRVIALGYKVGPSRGRDHDYPRVLVSPILATHTKGRVHVCVCACVCVCVCVGGGGGGGGGGKAVVIEGGEN